MAAMRKIFKFSKKVKDITDKKKEVKKIKIPSVEQNSKTDKKEITKPSAELKTASVFTTQGNKILAFEKLSKEAELGGGHDRIVKQHESGKLTARERINILLDAGTFVELDKLVVHRCVDFDMDKTKIPGDGIVSGYGKIDGKMVYVFAYDFTVFGGSLSRTNADKIIKLQRLAVRNGAPIIAINDSGGARIQEGVASLGGYADIFYLNVMASGVVPQISVIMGPCAGGAVYSPALTDFIFMVKEKSHMFVTGPEVIKAVTHEEVTKEDLGGAMTHNSKTGVAHFMGENEESTLMMIRELLQFLPSNNMEDSPIRSSTDDPRREDEKLQTLIPDDPNKPYDMKILINSVVDNGYFYEVMPYYAQNILIGFAFLGGKSVGIVANQPAMLAGVLDVDASLKAARFVRFCDCFNIPLITFEDVPGFLPGTIQEHNGVIKHGAKLLYAFSEATVPKITLITRKAYGGAYCVMSSKHIGADINYAYPAAEIAVMGSEGAVNILYRGVDAETKTKALEDYKQQFANPYQAAALGYIDEIILPKQTRYKLIQALEMTQNKTQSNPPKKHGNIPL
jgi:propionyl-CoA carboxylase beta chain